MLWGGRRDFLPKSQGVKRRGGKPADQLLLHHRNTSAQPLWGKGAPNLIEPRTVRAAVKTATRLTVALRPVLTAAVRGATSISQAGTEKRALKPNKETAP